MLRETLDYKDFLYVNAVGELLTPDSITKKFRKLLNEKELPYIKFHALRHSCISLLANNNQFSMKQIQDYAGHADFLTTFPVPNSNTKSVAVSTDIIIVYHNQSTLATYRLMCFFSRRKQRKLLFGN